MSRPALLALLVRALCSVLFCSFPVAACKGDAGAAPKTVSADAGTAAAASSACAEGYEKKSGKCVDIDECGGVANVCGPHPEAKCSNKPGTYECTCPEGFVGGGPGGFGCSAGLARKRIYIHSHICHVQAGGTVRCWKAQRGKRLVAESLLPFTDLVGVADLQVEVDNACALLRSGRVVCWGENEKGEVGDGTTVPRPSPVEMSGVEHAVAISVSSTGGCGLLHNGALSCWGRSNYGALGRGSVGEIGTPALVSNLSGVAAIKKDGFRTCAVLRTGALRCWGDNARSEMKGPRADSVLPVDFPGLKPVLSASMGMNSTCVLHADRTVSCWGNNLFGQLGNGTREHSDAPVAVKIDSVELLAGDLESQRAVRGGELYIWGRDLMTHPGQDSGGYVAEDAESIVLPRKIEGIREVESLSAPWCVVMRGHRLACGTGDKQLEVVDEPAGK